MTAEQLALVRDTHTPEDLIAEAKERWTPIRTICLFSGGKDSSVVAHRCRDHFDELAFIDTGTAVPGVREHVAEYAEWLGKPLRIMESGDAFRRMVLGGYTMTNGKEAPALGFPGPAQHGRAYSRLKERQIEALLKEVKVGHPRNARVLFVTGVRRAESKRRANREPLTKKRAACFVNPLIDWTGEDMRAYREEHELPESQVAALLCRSGECNCGSFAAPGERDELRTFWPEWFEETIGSLEREAETLGIPACRWGERPPSARREPAAPAGELCTDCQLRFDTAEEMAA